MPMTETRVAYVRHDLHERIAAIADRCGALDIRMLASRIDDLRSTAQTHGFTTVATIAAQLGSALARDIAGPTILCYLDALDDAVKLDPLRTPLQQQALLASVALRLNR